MSNENSLSGSQRPTRLLLMSSRARNKPAIYAAVWPHVKVLEYNYDSTTVEELHKSTVSHLGGEKVKSCCRSKVPTRRIQTFLVKL